jgi:uncharacterized protein
VGALLRSGSIEIQLPETIEKHFLSVKNLQGKKPEMSVFLKTAGMLALSNLFMTFAWYGHLKNLNHRAWYIAALVSWGIALFEYLIQVPANRIGYTQMTLPQLKILQEVITLTVFVPFAFLYMKQPLKLDYLWAALCILGAVYFIFRH